MRTHDVLPKRVPVLAGLAAAHAAWFAGYLVTAAVVFRAGREAVLDAAVGDTVSRVDPYQTVAWVFFNAHGVPVEVEPARRADDAAAFTATLVGGSDGVTPLVYGLPVVLLVAAGCAVALAADSRGPVDGFVAGLTVVPGYLALVVAGRLVASIAWSMSGGTAAPEAVAALARAGLLYPAVCAGLAGLVVGAVRGKAGPSPDLERSGG